MTMVEDRLQPDRSAGQRIRSWLYTLGAWICLVGLMLLSLCCLQESLPHALASHAKAACDMVPVSSFCSNAQRCIGVIGRRLGDVSFVQSNESSGQLLAEEFGSMYEHFGQAVAISNLLGYQAPNTTQKRLDLRDLKKHLPPGSTAIVPLDQFLNYSRHTGTGWHRYSSNIERVGDNVLEQYLATDKVLSLISSSPPPTPNWLQRYTYAIGWRTPQEELVQRQLKSNIDILKPAIREIILQGEEKIREANDLHDILTNAQSCTNNDLARYGQEKGDLMKEHHPFKRLLIKAFGAPEPREVVGLTKALKHTDGLLLWVKGEKKLLESAVHYLNEVASDADDLDNVLNEQDRAIR
ncbi:MAG: hypothetical protein Q9226_009075, partial [Calogaya cf. arnoldii]